MRLFLTLLLCCFWLTSARGETLRFAVEPYCPFGCLNAARSELDPDKPGFLVEVIRAIFRGEGYTLELTPMPFSRAVAAVRAGGVHGMLAMLKQDAPDLVFPTLEAGLAQGCFVVRRGDSWRYQGINSLRDKRFGGVADYTYGVLEQYLADYPKRGHVQLLSGEDALERNLEMLARGRIDVTLDDQNRIRYLFAQGIQGAQFEFAGCIDQPLWIFVPFSPAKPESAGLAQIYDQGIAELRRSGVLAEILARYGLKDWR